MNNKQPLSDLHRHLDGSLREATYLELATKLGLQVEAAPRFFAGMGLQAALSCFASTLRVLQDLDAVERVAAEIVEDARAEGVSTLEIRFAPQLHVSDPTQIDEMARVVDAAVQGVGSDAGLILCMLYGEEPALADALVNIALSRSAVVGVDLAGGPSPEHIYGMEHYADVFQRARRGGLGVTVHAGEGRPAPEIAVAIERLGAMRIGHGTTLLSDKRVLELVIERGVTIEACLTSNVDVDAIASVNHHPLPRWLALGVRCTICTDNTLLSGVSATSERELARQIPGMNEELMAMAEAYGHAARFGAM
ncbi:MAG TPA: hypothetical protein DCQ06_12295 [Myxococcales bacterium]|nr:hypothetical protein [Myxococcales bacterium]HAN32366.1 hypothetical protein [Myxococcales bacterium]